MTQVPARRVATVRFNRLGRAAELKAMDAELTDWVTDQGLSAIGDFQYAFYDAPMVPGSLRRNEVMIEVAFEPEAE